MKSALIIALTFILISCSKNRIMDDIILSHSSTLNSRPSKTIRAFSNSLEVEIPKSWKVTVSNDTFLSVDNRVLDDIDNYMIFSISIHNLKLDALGNEESLGRILNQIVFDKGCCNIMESGIVNNNSRIGYNISEDLEQKKLLGQNMLVTYLLQSNKNEDNYYFYLSHTYGVKRLENQELLFQIMNSLKGL